jgi:hypothetical protein
LICNIELYFINTDFIFYYSDSSKHPKGDESYYSKDTASNQYEPKSTKSTNLKISTISSNYPPIILPNSKINAKLSIPKLKTTSK